MSESSRNEIAVLIEQEDLWMLIRCYQDPMEYKISMLNYWLLQDSIYFFRKGKREALEIQANLNRP